MAKKNYFMVVCILFLGVISLNSVEQFVKLEFINKVSEPRYLEKGILFTFLPSIGDKIFIRTDLDNWKTNYYLEKSLFDIYYVVIPYNLAMKKMKYRVNIDGFWQHDTNNNNNSENDYGEIISELYIPYNVKRSMEMPIVEDTDARVKKVTFYYKDDSAREVSFVSSRDKWTPYSHQMQQDSNGYWKITIPFSQGIYYYFFFVDGEKTIDYENSAQSYDPINGDVSLLVIQ